MTRRLLLSYLSLTLFVLLLLEIPLAVSYARNERHDLGSKVERDAVALGAIAEDALERDKPADRGRLAKIAEDYAVGTGGRVLVVDEEGNALVDTSPPLPGDRSFASRPEVQQALGGEVATGTRHSDTLGVNLLYVAVPVSSGGVVHGAVRITYPTTAIDSRVHRYWLMLAAIAAIVLVAAVLVALKFARSTVRPLAQLEQAAVAAGEGDLTARAPLEGPPEIRSLAVRFNEMVGRLEDLLSSQEEFVADASHELRSPLAALRLEVDNLEREAAPDSRAGFEAVSRELERLSAVVDALLALARADAKTSAPEPVEVEEVVASRISLWSALCEEYGVTLVPQIESGMIASTTPGRLETILDNLLANSLQASPSGGTITISGRRVEAWAEIRVADEGRGMTPDELDRAFDRFWKAAGRSEGSGLGLAIVRRLVSLDGGQAKLEARSGGGLEAVVRLPAGSRRHQLSSSKRSVRPVMPVSREHLPPVGNS
jgi:signal transduction histidine kinase